MRAGALLPALLGRIEGRTLVLWVAATAAVWAFISIAEEVVEGDTHEIDQRLLLAMRVPGDLNDPLGSRTLEEAMRDVTALGGVTVVTLVTVTGVLAFMFHRRIWHALVLAVTVIVAQASSSIMKAAFGRPRPDLVPHGSYVYSASFPSGHSTLSAAMLLTLAMLIASIEPRRRTKALIYVVATGLVLAIGFSRVYLGVHWPSDVLAGWCLGAAWALAAWVVLLRLVPRPPAGR